MAFSATEIRLAPSFSAVKVLSLFLPPITGGFLSNQTKL
jgi:hypothetical protein